MNTSADISESIALLQKDFDLTVPDEELSREQLIKLLVPIVGDLLNRDLERLLQICYRIDLGEERLKRLLHEANPETMATELSEALVDRQLQKVEIRRKYQ
ncbi:hypothetical protein FKX85_08900 [Echinicola soli]|uniref:Uncharacterized protein n=1 Tax=Echinicola soli TaxID=2591634 RepID=A0A514CHM3_9BACT|nr:hypothetical protein [Echinicola soli]QDH79144.1 hypothetical protein FKX85_08900 [Echinicola soli]